MEIALWIGTGFFLASAFWLHFYDAIRAACRTREQRAPPALHWTAAK